MRFWVIKQYQVREHLDGAVGHVPRYEWILKTAVLEPEYEPTIFSRSCLDMVHTGYLPAHGLQDILELIPVVLVKVLSYLCHVVAACRQMLRVAGLDARTSIRDLKVGDVPVFDQVPKLGDYVEITELT